MTWTLGRDLPVLLDATFPLPLDTPFTARQAAAAGMSRHVLARLLREGLVRRVLKGVYVAAQTPDDLSLRTQALALVLPEEAAVTDWTACWMHTGMLPFGDHVHVPPVSVFRFAGKDRVRTGICRSGERTFLPQDLMSVDGVTVTTPIRTAWDVARFSHRDLAIVGLDALLRHGDFGKQELVAGIERFRRQRGVVQLRHLAPLADHRAESAGESVLRLRWLDLPSLPAPVPQVPVTSPSGAEIYRIDLGVEELHLGVEYDGQEHHSNDEDIEHDRERRAVLEHRHGWTIKVVRRHNVFGGTRDVERILHEGVVEARRRLGRFRPSA